MAKQSYGGSDSTKVTKTIVVKPLKKETEEQKERRIANAPMTNEEKVRKHGMPKIMASPTLPSVAYEKELQRRDKNRKL